MAKPKKDKQTSGGVAKKPVTADGEASKIWTDERFAHLVNDPRFKGIPKTEKKVKIDKRFQSMFKDEKFNVKHTIDKYGRKVKQAESDELRKYYEMESEPESEGGEEEPQEQEGDSDGSEDLELDDEEKAMAMPDKVKSRLEDLEVDYARGEGAIASDSSSDDDSEEEDDEQEVFIEHVWGELDADAERTDESTPRLALCNMDWDRVRAVDIMVMLSSFLPRGSTILSVTIYPSEFGKERMKEEEAQGPEELTAQRSDESEQEELDEEAAKEKQLERLREYQLNRLKYYYAVVECDNVDTADKLYKECDGVEYESTANKLDLRFIPDDMEFDDEPKEKCTELPEVGKYEPRVFITTALNQSKVELTWDENDVERKEFNEKIRAGKLADVKDTELKKYVACSSSEDESDGDGEVEQEESESEEEEIPDNKGKKSKKQDMIAKYKALLGEIKEQEDKERDEKVEMEFSWKVNGEEKEDEESESETEQKKQDNINPFEKILEKAKEKKKRRKELKKKKKRGELNTDGEEESEDDTPYGVDMNDPFFASAFDEKEFDLKKPSRKDKKQKDAEQEEEDEAESARKRAELELMLDDGEDDRSHFNLKAIQENEIDLKSVSKSKRKRILKKSKKQIEEQRQQMSAGGDDFEVNVDDDRFKAVYEKPEYNIDPTNPSFKKTKGMEKLIQEKLKKRPLKDNDLPGSKGDGLDEVTASEAKKPKRDVSTSLLVKSIKRKIGK
ncbi:ESF1 homolog [Aedes aegypti]|uniref:Uncharacterized protein n=1 Tax=Aedes aegypti TaxID=7159 RepID=A0A6I8T4A2_AEDAE|nr:ESF1 homolog [Aedes aegypti]